MTRKDGPDRIPKRILIKTAKDSKDEAKPLHALEAKDKVLVRFSKIRNRQHEYTVQDDVNNGDLDLIKEE